jgi:hypothetical protein
MWRPTMSKEQSDLLWMGWQSDGYFYTTDALMRAMDSYNRRTLEICRTLDVECVDLASKLPPTIDVFYDDMHLNEGGARSVASDLISYFRTRAPFAASGAEAAIR